jgi:hypothetical protein
VSLFLIAEIADSIVRENFQRLTRYINNQKILKGQFNHIELSFSGAVTNFRYPHHLGFVPKDVIQTRQTGSGTLTWNYARFDETYLDITTTGAVDVRAFVGRYSETNNA